jgi:hypothetical protein
MKSLYRALLARYIRATFKPGVHYGIIPVGGQNNSKTERGYHGRARRSVGCWPSCN